MGKTKNATPAERIALSVGKGRTRIVTSMLASLSTKVQSETVALISELQEVFAFMESKTKRCVAILAKLAKLHAKDGGEQSKVYKDVSVALKNIYGYDVKSSVFRTAKMRAKDAEDPERVKDTQAQSANGASHAAKGNKTSTTRRTASKSYATIGDALSAATVVDDALHTLASGITSAQAKVIRNFAKRWTKLADAADARATVKDAKDAAKKRTPKKVAPKKDAKKDEAPVDVSAQVELLAEALGAVVVSN